MERRKQKRAPNIIPLYQKFKKDSRGWGLPPFEEFKTRLAPLRAKRTKEDWSESEMMYVMELQAAGAGYALCEFFRHGPVIPPVVLEILGYGGPDDLPRPEPLGRADLELHMGKLIRSCRRDGWGARNFVEFMQFLDSRRTVRDLIDDSKEEAKGAEPEKPPTARGEEDGFTLMYRAAGPAFQEKVREMLTAAAGEEPQ